MPVWHVSISVWSKDRKAKRSAPDQAEMEAVKLLRGVGDPEREWWIWNPVAMVGHLRVPVTAVEYAQVPPGCVVGDAGETGPLRRRTR
jgi:hypothetical protein